MRADIDTVCLFIAFCLQLKQVDSFDLTKEAAKDLIMRYTRKGWFPKLKPPDKTKENYTEEDFKKISTSLSIARGCLFYGLRVVIRGFFKAEVLQMLYMRHLGM